MTPTEQMLVQKTWLSVEPIAPQAAALFYDKLFELDPSLKPLFKRDMKRQGRMLMTMLGTAVRSLETPEKVVPTLQQLGVRHVDYGVTEDHYDTVAAALLDTLAKGLGPEFTSEVEAAWTRAYHLIADTMKAAAVDSTSKQPSGEASTQR